MAETRDGAGEETEETEETTAAPPEEGLVQAEDDGTAESAVEDEFAARLKALEEELAAAHDKELRLLADMENMRRRFAEREERLTLDITAEVLRGLLPAVDNLERAVKAAEGDEGPLATGVRLSLDLLRDSMARLGARRFSAVGEPFDPGRHEALAQEERSDVPAGTVVEEFVAGWELEGRVLRPALVKVARG